MDMSALNASLIQTVFPLVIGKLVEDGELDGAIDLFLELEEDAEEFAQRFADKLNAARADLRDRLEKVGGAALVARLDDRRQARRSERLTVRDGEVVKDPVG
ncbi:MAG: hypothetical protein AAFY19_00365 [Pseudomonadota bacterium]